jgi:hypothetical protein
MIKALLLIFDPANTWDSIAKAQRTVGFVLFVYLLPVLLVSAAGEAYGLVTWGKAQQDISHTQVYTWVGAAAYEAAYTLITIVLVFICAHLIRSMGDTFHGRHTFTQAFRVVAYGLSPIFLFRVMDTFTMISPWIGWGIGALLTVGILYHGVPRVLEPDPSHAFGLYLTSSLVVVAITGLLRFASIAYLDGKFQALHRVMPQ